MCRHFRIGGWSLLEAITTLCIVSIMTALAIPSWDHFRAQSQRASAVQELVSLFAYARSEAVTMRRVISLCGSADGSSCENTSTTQFLVFSDENNNHRAEPAEILRTETAPANVRYQISTSTQNSFRFRPDGTALSYGHVALCPAHADNHYAAEVILSNQGRVRHARDRNGDGVVESRGRAVPCP